MKLLILILSPLLIANVILWWPHSVIFSLCWAVVMIASPKLLPE